MHRVSHRGNMFGRSLDKENHPHYIEAALNAGYECEIDVWRVGNIWMLGHDNPQYYVNIQWLDNPKLWIHAKNADAMLLMPKTFHNVFWHESDLMALTSRGFIWTVSHHIHNSKVIIMCVENTEFPSSDILRRVGGVCSDYIGRL